MTNEFNHRSAKFPHAQALAVAQELMALLSPACERIAIVGSLRRQRREVGDAELLFVPKIISEMDGLFESKPVSLAERMIEGWLTEGRLAKRLAVTEKPSAWGRLNKHAVHVASGIGVDLFSEPDPLDWPRSLCIRTGPADFNVRLMESARAHKLNAHAYGEALHRIGNGERVIAKDERDFIELCGLPWSEPENRR